MIAPNATLADALSTAMFLLGPEDAIELAKSYPDVNAIIYYQNGEEIISMRTMGVKDILERKMEVKAIYRVSRTNETSPSTRWG